MIDAHRALYAESSRAAISVQYPKLQSSDFTLTSDSWYCSFMNRSYVGIVTLRGLEAIYPEDNQVIRFLNRRVVRKRSNSCLCWAVLSDEVLDCIEQQLVGGEHRLAFWTMQAHADFCGSILPSHADDESRENEATPA